MSSLPALSSASLLDAASCHTATLRTTFASAAHASLAQRSLEVDAELQAGKAAKDFAVEGADLVVRMRATELRVLRVVLASMFDRLTIVCRVLRDHAG